MKIHAYIIYLNTHTHIRTGPQGARRWENAMRMLLAIVFHIHIHMYYIFTYTHVHTQGHRERGCGGREGCITYLQTRMHTQGHRERGGGGRERSTYADDSDSERRPEKKAKKKPEEGSSKKVKQTAYKEDLGSDADRGTSSSKKKPEKKPEVVKKPREGPVLCPYPLNVHAKMPPVCHVCVCV